MTALHQRWTVFSAAPHRLMFCAGSVQVVLALLYWSVELGTRQAGGGTLPTALAATWAHALLMLYGVFPFFIFGFLMTTYPRWMNGRELGRRAYVPAWAALVAGQALVWGGLLALGRPALLAGLVAMLAGWAWAVAQLYRVYRSTPAGDKRHETVLNGALALGWLGLAGFAAWLAAGWPFGLAFALQAGLWGFLLPVFFTVCHRMIPFFSACVLADYQVVKPAWSLPLWCAGSLLHGALELAGAPQWTWLVDLPLAATALWHSAAWGLLRAQRIRLLGVLHLAFAWMGVGLALYGVQSLALLGGGHAPLGRGPLHALAIGFFAAMVVGMASRVTLGHSGRPLVADTYTWACFLGVNAAALLRVAGDALALPALTLLAALVALAAFAAWALRFAPIYLRPRADGRPG
ncbi:uncharacterized protein involved in response to NO [Plasticicumulans lactativorans]|uniref:Uncharacterized protein involved in response to NO n=1 Tax=Plasticicumulans lactativorans TaxID=1133106 RepID=A0A4R2LAJ4_9GAMM|nr:NnrS family protein [Plasticicumulans lactativorans]TCO82437.1 uncharacterized protein involved in response to NO [Plasticicumulans lactativorans]